MEIHAYFTSQLAAHLFLLAEDPPEPGTEAETDKADRERAPADLCPHGDDGAVGQMGNQQIFTERSTDSML